MSLSARLARLVGRSTTAVERAAVLDAPSEALDQVASRIPVGPVKDVLSGVALGHPLHPVLVTVPIGAFTSALVLDVTGREQSAARTLVGLGLLSSVPTALAGLTDWSDTRGAERRVGLAHLALNVVGLGVIGASWLSRRRDPGTGRFDAHGPWLTLTGFGIVGASAWLGGHLAYAMGVGVDTTAFQRPPTEWADAVDDADLVEGQPVAVPSRPRRSSSCGPEAASTPSPTGAPTGAARSTRARSPTGASNVRGTRAGSPSRTAPSSRAPLPGPRRCSRPAWSTAGSRSAATRSGPCG